MADLTQPTAKKITRHYSAARGSVSLINAGKHNQEHLQIMLAKTFWTTENLAPLQQAAL